MPASFINIFLTASVLYYGLGEWGITIISLLLILATFYFIRRGSLSKTKQDTVRVIRADDIRAQLSSGAEG